MKQTRLLDNEHERAFDAFYPFIPGGSIEQFVADYFGNRAPILFLCSSMTMWVGTAPVLTISS